MLKKDYYLDNLSKSHKLRLDLSTRNPNEVGELVDFLKQNQEKYGKTDQDLAKYGRLYLITTKEQRKKFFEDLFAPTPQLTKIIEVKYEETKCRIPEKALNSTRY